MSVIDWSRTAADNGDADTSINFREGQAPRSYNDSARALMAAVACWRDDLAGNIETAGTASAYTLATYQTFSALVDGMVVAFVPHDTNNASATLAVDGLTAKALRVQTGVAIPAGVLIAGTPYTATYNESADEFRVHGVPAVGAMVPIGAMMPFVGSSAPNSAFALPYGQAISRTTYAGLFALCSTTYGAGDGSTTFNLPDIRGRVIAGLDNMGGTSANRLTAQSGGVNGDTRGAAGGSETHTLTEAQLAVHDHAKGSLGGTAANHTHSYTDYTMPNNGRGTSDNGSISEGGDQPVARTTGASGSLALSITGSVANAGSGAAHNNVQPTIILPYILRVL